MCLAFVKFEKNIRKGVLPLEFLKSKTTNCEEFHGHCYNGAPTCGLKN